MSKVSMSHCQSSLTDTKVAPQRCQSPPLIRRVASTLEQRDQAISSQALEDHAAHGTQAARHVQSTSEAGTHHAMMGISSILTKVVTGCNPACYTRLHSRKRCFKLRMRLTGVGHACCWQKVAASSRSHGFISYLQSPCFPCTAVGHAADELAETAHQSSISTAQTIMVVPSSAPTHQSLAKAVTNSKLWP